jgi:hypothetical protein
MDLQRTVTVCLPDDPDLRATLLAFLAVQNAVTRACYNGGNPLSAVQLQRVVYAQVKGTLNSQMTITALRLVAGGYAAAKRGYARRLLQEKRREERCERKGWVYTPHAIAPPGVCQFTKPAAMFLVGKRGRDADFRADGTLSIWTVAGRKHIGYTVPAKLRPLFEAATEIDSVTVIQALLTKAQMMGMAVVFVDPAYTGQTCARCGLRGVRRRHRFTCAPCGHQAHADLNAAVNIRQRFVQSRLDGEQSISPEARPRGGKRATLAL